MAREKIPDDIDLLNIYRFPESASLNLVTRIKNSQECQKRLEYLLREISGKKEPPKKQNILFQHNANSSEKKVKTE